MDWKIVFIIATLSLSACTSTKTASTSTARSCNSLTPNGLSLCNALNETDREAARIGNISKRLDNKKFDYAMIGFGILSTAALAANSHASLLEGLGIATAATAGIKTYNNVSGRIGIYSQAMNSLLCLETSAEPALIQDDKIGVLKNYVNHLSEARSLIPTYMNNTNITIPTLTPTLSALAGPSEATVELGNSALVSYAIVGDIVEVMTRDIITAMNLSIENKRDLSTIINNIEATVRQQQSEIDQTEGQANETGNALKNTQDPPANLTQKQQALKLLQDSPANFRSSLFAIRSDNEKALELIIAIRESMTFIKDNAPQIQNAVTNVKACKKN